MTERLLFPEFRNELEDTSYPFADTASRTTTAGTATIAKGSFLDATLYPVGSTARLGIMEITVTATLITLWIGDSAIPHRCYAAFDPLQPPDILAVVDTYSRPAGMLVSESLRLAQFATWDTGSHVFDEGAAEFVASCVIPMPAIGVTGLRVGDGEVLTGDVWIIGERGVVVRLEDSKIRVDVVGDPLFVRKLCGEATLFNPPAYVQTINGRPPNELGDYRLEITNAFAPETILRLVPTGAGLRIEAVGNNVKRDA